jgi:hypothetical protein
LLQPHVRNRHAVADSGRSELFALQQSIENNVVIDVQHDSRPVSEMVQQCPLVMQGEVNDRVDNPADRLKVDFSALDEAHVFRRMYAAQSHATGPRRKAGRCPIT